jgi:hypothetical protein
MFNWLRNIRIALFHASYHRNLKKAEACKDDKDLQGFQKYVYRAEDAWRKLVILTEKNKK